MEQSRSTIAFVTVLVVTLALVYRGGDAPAPAPGVSEETATPDTAIPTTPACALAQLLARSVPDIRSAPPAETRDPGDCGLRQWSAESLDVIVALVPAPFGSNGSWRFDGMLSAVRGELSRVRYTPVSFGPLQWWYPERAEHADRDAALVEAALSSPGFMVFRRHASPTQAGRGHEVLVLALVAETPNAGPNITALSAALQISKVWEHPARRYRILGPTFSGSVPVVATTIGRAFDGERLRRLQVISGTADSRLNRSLFRQQRVHFASVLPSNDHLAEAFGIFLQARERPMMLWNLASRREEPPHIARIVEESAYGGSIGQGGIVGTFPLHISQLNRYAQSQTDGETGVLPAKVPLSLVPERMTTDSPPPMHAALTTATAELTLLDQMRAVSRHGAVSALLIAGSEIRDLMWVSTAAASVMPSVPRVMVNAEPLLRHPEMNKAVRGGLVISALPPAAFVSGEDTVYASSPSFGVALATRRLVDATDARRPSASVDHTAHERGCAAGPGVWVSLIGHGTVVPVAVVPIPQDMAARARLNGWIGPNPKLCSDAVHSSAALWGCLVVAAIALVSFGPLRERSARPDHRGTVARYRLLRGLAGGALLLNLIAPTAFVLWRSHTVAATLTVLGSLAYLGWSTRATSRAWHTSQQGARRRLHVGVRRALVIVSVAAAAMSVLAALAPFFVEVGTTNRDLLMARFVNVTAGVSPLLPLMFVCAGVLVWSQAHLLVRWREGARTEGVAGRDASDVFLLAVEPEHQCALSPPSESALESVPILDLALCVAYAAGWVAIAGLLTGGLPYASIEPEVFDVLLTAGVFVLTLLMTVGLVQALRGWRTLRRCLEHLATSPAATGLRRLGRFPAFTMSATLAPRQPTRHDVGLLLGAADRWLQLRGYPSERWSRPAEHAATPWSESAEWVRLREAGTDAALTLMDDAELTDAERVAAEDAAAAVVAIRVQDMLWRLRLRMFVASGLMFCVLAVHASYLFFALPVLAKWGWVHVGVVAGGLAAILVSMDRNYALGLMRGEEHPGKFSWHGEVLLRVFGVIAIPAATVALAQFPMLHDAVREVLPHLRTISP